VDAGGCIHVSIFGLVEEEEIESGNGNGRVESGSLST
jgi:hypothetical protein